MKHSNERFSSAFPTKIQTSSGNTQYPSQLDCIFTDLRITYYMLYPSPSFDVNILQTKIHDGLASDAEITKKILLFTERRCLININFPTLLRIDQNILSSKLTNVLTMEGWGFNANVIVRSSLYYLTYSGSIGSVTRELCLSKFVYKFIYWIDGDLIIVKAIIIGDIKNSKLTYNNCSHSVSQDRSITESPMGISCKGIIETPTGISCKGIIGGFLSEEDCIPGRKFVTNYYNSFPRLMFHCTDDNLAFYYNSFHDDSVIYVNIKDSQNLIFGLSSS